MFDFTPILLLLMQAMLAIITVKHLGRNVFASIREMAEHELISDVWGAIALILPMLFFIARVEYSVEGIGWMGFGGPIACGVLGLGAGMVVVDVSHVTAIRRMLSPRAIACWIGTGIVLLLLGAAHDLTLWMGQCAFAAAAILLWINTPAHDVAGPPVTPAQVRAGFGTILALLCATGQGAIALILPPNYAQVSGGMMIATAAMSLAAAARLAGPAIATRLGGWAASFGVLLSLGLLSMIRLAPEVVSALRQRPVEPIRRIAYGFEAYWIEALALLLLAPAAIALLYVPPKLARVIGLLLIIAAAVLAGWRLSQI